MIDSIAYVTWGLLILMTGISLSAFSRYSIIEAMRHYPYQESRDHSFYRWMSCGFVHGNYLHLILNAFVLYQFGAVIENLYTSRFGSVPGGSIFLIVYLLILILSCMPTYFRYRNNPSYASIGASGAISGILFIYIYHFPLNTLYFYGIVPIPAILMGVLYLVYSWWAARNTHDGIDHEAHYYGAIMGLAFGILIDKLPF